MHHYYTQFQSWLSNKPHLKNTLENIAILVQTRYYSFLDSRGSKNWHMKVVNKAHIAAVLSKILKDLYQEGNWLDVMSCKRHKENPVMDSSDHNLIK